MNTPKYFVIGLLLLIPFFLTACELTNKEFENYSYQPDLSCKYLSASDSYLDKWLTISGLDTGSPEVTFPDEESYAAKRTYNDGVTILLEIKNTVNSDNETIRITKKSGEFSHSGFLEGKNTFNKSGRCK